MENRQTPMTVRAGELIARPLEAQDWKVDGLFRTNRKRASVLAGKPGSGKSTLAWQLAIALVKRRAILSACLQALWSSLLAIRRNRERNQPNFAGARLRPRAGCGSSHRTRRGLRRHRWGTGQSTRGVSGSKPKRPICNSRNAGRFSQAVWCQREHGGESRVWAFREASHGKVCPASKLSLFAPDEERAYGGQRRRFARC